MDLISNIFSTMRVNASIFLHSSFCSEWVIDLSDGNLATFHIISHGDCWLHLADREPVALHEKDLLVLPHNASHLLTNSPNPPRPDTPRNTPAEVISGTTVTLICGTVDFSQNYWNPLVEALPEYIIMPTLSSRGATLTNVINSLIDECERNEAGSEAIIDRLSDILFIEVVRNYVKKNHGSDFLIAMSDKKIGKALEALHADPGNNWNVQNLAEVACMSRSAFAERFLHLIGTSPMSYVTRWRMQHAHCKLTETTESIGDISASCGYQNEESFGKTFRKEFGFSPKAVRRRDTAAEINEMLCVGSEDSAPVKTLYSSREANHLRNNNEATFVDVRDANIYEQGHIPGAVNIPELFHTLSMTTPDGLQELETSLVRLFRKAGISNDKTVIVYENNLDSQFGASCRGYFLFVLCGHPNVGLMDGGLDEWKKEGYPIDNHPVQATLSHFKAEIHRGALATLDDVLMSFEHPEIKLLDNRDKDEWLGISAAPAALYGDDFVPRKGRIPGARWIEWHEFMQCSDGVFRFKSQDQIFAICAQVGLYPDDDIIIYCFKGARASNTYIALKLAGFKHVRNYYGSWNEWSRNASLPAVSAKLLG
ncbi:MAG: cupin domain-containing protein [Pseudomonadales bacterium]